MPSTFPCPKCGEYHYHKSHSKTTYERLRKKIFRQRIYRCHMCGYRAWERQRAISHMLTKRQVILYIIAGIMATFLGYLCKFIII